MTQPKTINISIPHPEEVFNEAFMPFIKQLKEVRKPLLIFEGGRGSGKSRGVAQGIILRAMKQRIRIALVRKVADTIRDSIYKEITDVINDWELQLFFNATVSPLAIKVSNGSEFLCKGLDKAEKIKSIANVDVVIVEEATELTKEDWTTLSLSIRGKKKDDEPKQKILVFNRQAGHWTETEFFNSTGEFIQKPGIYHSHTTFFDNKFLDQPFLDDLEAMKVQAPDLYRKNALGLPVALTGLIYQNWDIEPMPEGLPLIYGLDFGFNDPIVLLSLAIQGNDIWIDELYYERKKTTGDLLSVMPKLLSKNAMIWADSAEADRIEEMKRAGWYVRGADKGKRSVQDGIDLVKRYRLHITPRSLNTKRDFENYKWKETKQGPLDEPMHAYSHGPDAVRYPVWMSERAASPVKVGEVQIPEMVSVGITELY